MYKILWTFGLLMIVNELFAQNDQSTLSLSLKYDEITALEEKYVSIAEKYLPEEKENKIKFVLEAYKAKRTKWEKNWLFYLKNYQQINENSLKGVSKQMTKQYLKLMKKRMKVQKKYVRKMSKVSDVYGHKLLKLDMYIWNTMNTYLLEESRFYQLE